MNILKNLANIYIYNIEAMHIKLHKFYQKTTSI